MTPETPSRTFALAIAFGAIGSTVAACGSEEMFVPELGSNERLIEREAVARISVDDQAVEFLAVVGDLDGDGIDDAIVRSYYRNGPSREGEFPDYGASLFVLYGGSTVTGKIDISTLPSLTDLGFWAEYAGSGISALGDVNGDGLADFLVGVPRRLVGVAPSTTTCSNRLKAGGPVDADMYSGVYLVYGSSTRLTGTAPIGSAGVFLREPTPCTEANFQVGIGDFDGDGKADFAIGNTDPTDPTSYASQIFMFYGRGERLSGTVDLVSTADAVISVPRSEGYLFPRVARVGDVDGDGYGDFLIELMAGPSADSVRLLRGAAARLSGGVVLGDLAQSRFVFEPCSYMPGPGDALGDLDGDGVDDFSMPSCSTYLEPPVQHVFYGRSAGFPAQVGLDGADATLEMSDYGLPSHLAGADVDGDGVRDLIVSDSGSHDGNGAVHVIRGNGVRLSGAVELGVGSVGYVGATERGTRCAYHQPSCPTPADVGAGLDVGDLTGDHRADILVSAPFNQDLPPDLGVHGSSLARVYLVSPPAAPKP